MGKKMYNAMFDVAFTVVTKYKDWRRIPNEILLAGLQDRLNELRSFPAECGDAMGFCDQFEVDPPATKTVPQYHVTS